MNKDFLHTSFVILAKAGIYGLAIACLLMPAYASAATIGKPVSNLGLLGYWSFDEGGGTKAHDLSGRGNTGTLTNSPTWVDGKRGKALSFSSASSQYVSVGSSFLSGNDPFTIAAWVNPADVTTTWKTIFAENCNGPDLTINQGTITAGRNCGQGNSFNLSHALAASEANTWIFVTMTFDGANARLYKNGVLVSGPVAATYAAGGHGAAYIGSYSTTFEPFNGKIDDVRLYGRELSVSEIGALYASGQASNLAATKTGLIGHWSFNEGSGTIAHDQSGASNNLTMNNFASPSTPSSGWTNGKRGRALVFDASNDTLSRASTNLNLSGNFSISFWIKTTTLASYNPVLSKYTDLNSAAYIGIHSSDGLRFECSDVGQTTRNLDWTVGGATNTLLSNNAWHLATYTYNGSNVSLYVDGSYVTQSPSWTYGCGNVTDTFYIGAFWAGVFNGSLDDVRIYNRSLSATEVSALYRSTETTINQSQNNKLTNGLVGYWTFNGPDVTTTVADVSGQGNHAYLFNSATSSAKTRGRVGQAFQFDGVDDYVQTNTSLFNKTNGQELSVSVWIKPTRLAGQYQGIVNNRSVSGYNWHVYQHTTDGSVQLHGSAQNKSTYIPPVNAWTHIVSTVDASGNYVLYANGVVVQTVPGYTYQGDSPSQLNIGSTHPGAEPYSGSVDEVRIYNRALTAAEAKQLYNMGR